MMIRALKLCKPAFSYILQGAPGGVGANIHACKRLAWISSQGQHQRYIRWKRVYQVGAEEEAFSK
jgi:hypothetical protein